ncbi:MAG TPA: class I SAM-dependent methyltransferase [Gammaproteobacteria bacterium]|nr:class I SAM-dependent methyltransferase [Gammaproteobacteria bacterium]
MADQMTGLLSGWLRRRRLDKADPYLRGRVLDYGCGVGMLASYCTREGYLGVDIDGPSLEIARARHPGYRFATVLPPGRERFDTIVALAVIEHVPRPAALLRQFARRLEPDGTIILTTPHPSLEWVHTLGASIGLFSSEASEEHEELIDLRRMRELGDEARLTVQTYERFLFGANQLFVLGHGAARGRGEDVEPLHEKADAAEEEQV